MTFYLSKLQTKTKNEEENETNQKMCEKLSPVFSDSLYWFIYNVCY